MTQSAPKAPVIGGSKSQEVSLEASVFGAELRPHLIHEAVRAVVTAARAGTRGAKSRGLGAGGGSKPWRQKGTGRARAGTTRAPHWTGAGVAFPPVMRSFEVKVNRKARRAAFCGALSNHAAEGTFAILDGSAFEKPSTRQAAELLSGFGTRPTVVVVTDDNPDSKAWKQEVGKGALLARAEQPGHLSRLLDGPLAVTFYFYRPRPKGHYKGSGELSKAGKESPYPTSKPGRGR